MSFEFVVGRGRDITFITLTNESRTRSELFSSRRKTRSLPNPFNAIVFSAGLGVALAERFSYLLLLPMVSAWDGFKEYFDELDKSAGAS